jgi:hypothetical protein
MRLNYNIYFVVIEQIESVSMRTPSPQFNQELEDLRIEVEDLKKYLKEIYLKVNFHLKYKFYKLNK